MQLFRAEQVIKTSASHLNVAPVCVCVCVQDVLPLWTLFPPACGICRWTAGRRCGSEPAMEEEHQGDLFSCITVDDVRASRLLTVFKSGLKSCHVIESSNQTDPVVRLLLSHQDFV